MDKKVLDAYITKEPDNGYTEWVESVWDLIPEDKISGDEYDKYESFFDEGAETISYAGADGGYPEPDFAAGVLIKRFKVLKENEELKTWMDVQQLVSKRGY